MRSPKLCAVITKFYEKFLDKANMSDIIEVRIDMIGESWTSLASKLKRPWIACNRRKEEGGMWYDTEERRVNELLKALKLGAEYVDIELLSPNLNSVVEKVKLEGKKVIVSYHDFNGTPDFLELKKIFEETKLPVLVINRKLPDLAKVKKALKRFEDFEERWQAVENAGKIKECYIKDFKKVYYQNIGIDDSTAREIIKLSCTRSYIPEPLRIAHIIATGIVKGESYGRA